MFTGCFNCFGITKEEKHVCLSLNSINKLVIHNNTEKLPNLHNKSEIMALLEKMNTVSRTVLGGTIEFNIQNPNELSDKIKNTVVYNIFMYNTKTRNIINRLNFNFLFDIIEGTTALTIEPFKNEQIMTTHWTFLESVLYNIGFRIKKIYAQKK